MDTQSTKLVTDPVITISVGDSRMSTNWKMTTYVWNDFCKRLTEVTVTTETVSDYTAMTKDARTAIKDVGGYVGALLKSNRRVNSDVVMRTLVTLDADYASPDFIDQVHNKLPGLFWFAHTTRQHTEEKPRWRLILPVSREVLPEEYGALSRKVADIISIDQFDDTTYDINRLMYWPSVSSDGSFKTARGDGELLDPDAILALYPGGAWQDQSQWPHSIRIVGTMKSSGENVGDPSGKPGIIGAFCRTYSVPKAIAAFLPDIYHACAGYGKRYTYTPASSSGGLVIYNGGISAFSFHATDPASGHALNAFDLVRIHKFGELDADLPEETPVTDLPSHTEMCNFASADSLVCENLEQDRQAKISVDFGEEATANVDVSWTAQLKRNPKTGEILPKRRNIEIILENEPRLKNRFGKNEFTGRLEVTGNLPWRKKDDFTTREGMYWVDADDSQLRTFLEEFYTISNPSKVADALAAVMEKNRFNPVLQEINSLQWDGILRLETMLIDYLGAEDSPYVRTVTRKTIISLVRRIRNPGCKFDNVLTLKGPQGLGKSTLLAILGGKYFSDSIVSFTGKEAVEQLMGFMLLEVAELSALKRSESETAKQFLSKKEDVVRLAYDRRPKILPRKCIFVATTNEENFLKDQTGNRRFWVVPVGVQAPTLDVWKDLPGYSRDQILAEAAYYEKNGEQLHLDKDIEILAKAQQEAHREVSPWEDTIRNFLAMPLPTDWETRSLEERRVYIEWYNSGSEDSSVVPRTKVCAMEIWQELLRQDKATLTGQKSKEIISVLSNCPGWKRHGKLRFKWYNVQLAFVTDEIE